jgi:G3E family GTPase
MNLFKRAETLAVGDSLSWNAVLAELPFNAGCDKKAVYQGVHMLMTETFGNPWQPGESKESNLVFIGRNLPKQDMLEALKSCQVAP